MSLESFFSGGVARLHLLHSIGPDGALALRRVTKKLRSAIDECNFWAHLVLPHDLPREDTQFRGYLSVAWLFRGSVDVDGDFPESRWASALALLASGLMARLQSDDKMETVTARVYPSMRSGTPYTAVLERRSKVLCWKSCTCINGKSKWCVHTLATVLALMHVKKGWVSIVYDGRLEAPRKNEFYGDPKNAAKSADVERAARLLIQVVTKKAKLRGTYEGSKLGFYHASDRVKLSNVIGKPIHVIPATLGGCIEVAPSRGRGRKSRK